MSDTNFTLIMLEFEKLTTKLDKLEKEVVEFKELVFPLQTINITHESTPELIGNLDFKLNSYIPGGYDEH